MIALWGHVTYLNYHSGSTFVPILNFISCGTRCCVHVTLKPINKSDLLSHIFILTNFSIVWIILCGEANIINEAQFITRMQDVTDRSMFM